MVDSNKIGKRGESIFSTKISKGFILDPSFLGDKYEAIDFIIDLNSLPNHKAFFFVSVKTTSNAKYSPKNNRLKIQVNKKQLGELKKLKIPTYIVGVDEKKEKAFIISVKGIKVDSISSIPTSFSLNQKKNIQDLWNEVKEYWDDLKHIKANTSKFIYK